MIDGAQTAALATLMLRGPQTLAELRANAAPLKGPADDAAMATVLNDLMERATPMVTQLSRSSGKSALRFAHCLSGAPAEAAAINETISVAPPVADDRIAALEARIAALESRIGSLEQQLGVSPAS